MTFHTTATECGAGTRSPAEQHDRHANPLRVRTSEILSHSLTGRSGVAKMLTWRTPFVAISGSSAIEICGQTASVHTGWMRQKMSSLESVAVHTCANLVRGVDS